jgi:hypothetical protein
MQASTQHSLEPRTSNGLDQFVAALREHGSPDILDLSGANQWNLDFLSARGRLTSDEFTYAATTAFGSGSGDFFQNQSESNRIESFCRLSLDYPAGSFDAILVWDCLEYLAPEMLEEVVSHLHDISRPGALMLCYFHADQAAKTLPVTQFRIIDAKTIQTATRQSHRPTQFYSNRAIERIFQNFQSVKFFLTRDYLREVIVRR